MITDMEKIKLAQLVMVVRELVYLEREIDGQQAQMLAVDMVPP